MIADSDHGMFDSPAFGVLCSTGGPFMPRNVRLVAGALAAATSAVLVLNSPLSAAKPPSTSAGTAVFRNAPDDTISGDTTGTYSGVFDKDGNFSFDTGSQRTVSFTFGPPLALLGNTQAPTGSADPPSGSITQV